MKVYILRHGETKWNSEIRLQGQKNIDLNEKGIRLARLTGEKIRELPVDICFTSPLQRAKDTAALVLNGRDIPMVEDARLMEISFGCYEGLRCSRREAEVPQEFLDLFYNEPFAFQAPEGGENFTQLCERTGAFLKDLVSREELMDKCVMLSCHGGSARALLYMMSKDRRPENFWRGSVPPNVSITTVEYQDGSFTLVDLDRIYYDKNEWRNSYAR